MISGEGPRCTEARGGRVAAWSGLVAMGMERDEPDQRLMGKIHW